MEQQQAGCDIGRHQIDVLKQSGQNVGDVVEYFFGSDRISLAGTTPLKLKRNPFRRFDKLSLRRYIYCVPEQHEQQSSLQRHFHNDL